MLSRRRLATGTAIAELTAPTAVGSGDLGIMVYPLNGENGAGFWPTATPKAAP